MNTFKTRIVFSLGAGLVLTILALIMHADDKSKAEGDSTKTEKATFGGGCFWCTEAVFETMEGVHSVTSGYEGGKTVKPTYQQICTGETGHAEVIQIEFDPSKVAYEELLTTFWKAHNPTTLNRQGADTGTQYRSIILYHNEKQKQTAEKSKKDITASFSKPVVTEIVETSKFYPAEDYHQDYFKKNPSAGYCVFVIRPKLEKLGKDK